MVCTDAIVTLPKPPMENVERSSSASGHRVTSASLAAESRLESASPAMTMVSREAPVLHARP